MAADSPPARRVAVWIAPAVCGVVLALVALRLGNPLLPVGSAEVATAFALGAVLRARPFLTGILLVVPPAAVLLADRAGSTADVLTTLAVFSAFALFNGAAAGAGATWAGEIGRRQRGAAPAAAPPDPPA